MHVGAHLMRILGSLLSNCDLTHQLRKHIIPPLYHQHVSKWPQLSQNIPWIFKIPIGISLRKIIVSYASDTCGLGRQLDVLLLTWRSHLIGVRLLLNVSWTWYFLHRHHRRTPGWGVRLDEIGSASALGLWNPFLLCRMLEYDVQRENSLRNFHIVFF